MREFEKEFHAAVDIPQMDHQGKLSDEWINVRYFYTKEEAIEWAQENLGADENGMISVISTF